MADQSIKQDAGKLDMGAVYRHFPLALKAAAKVREFSRVEKNRHNFTWEDVDIERWRQSFERHFTDWNMIDPTDWLEYLKLNADEESGLPQHWHMLVSLMAIIELEEREKLNPDNKAPSHEKHET